MLNIKVVDVEVDIKDQPLLQLQFNFSYIFVPALNQTDQNTLSVSYSEPNSVDNFIDDGNGSVAGIEMNGLPGRKLQDIENPFPGCLGTIINLFDLGTAVGGNMLLTDKPHLESSSLTRSRSDVARMRSSSYEARMEEKFIVSELRKSSSNKSNGTPMKKLLAREMSKEVNHRQNPTNVVAKLMGLDTLPQQQSDAAAQQSKHIGSSQCSSNHEAQKCHQCSKYKEVYETWLQSTKMNYLSDDSPKKRTHDVNINEKKMALVRQKFMEAKRLVTDEKSHQSREFQDALDVLSSNKDLFVKFLQESNSFFSQHLGDFQPVSPLLDTRRITVLRPSRTVDTEHLVVHGKRIIKHVKDSVLVPKGTGWGKAIPEFPSFVNRRAEEVPTQPTRIVVLKPNPLNAIDVKPVTSSSPSSPRIWHGGNSIDEAEDVGSREAREMAKELTSEMRENMTGHGRDETILSFLSNGYIGNDSSFHKSEIEYAEGNSDFEIMSPSSRHSWDCINRFGSPYSSSSFSRASFSPESSVCREAKKRLSERWAMVSSNGTFQQEKHVSKSSSTLGEMLALPDTKNLTIPQDARNKGKLEARASTSILSSGIHQDESTSDSPKSLLRSKSVPLSATSSGTRLNVEVPASVATQSQVPRELSVSKSMKSSWKVTSLFSFRNKKATKGKSSASCSSSNSQVATPGTTPASPPNSSDNAFQCFNEVVCEECLSPDTRLLYGHEDELSLAKAGACASQCENPNQPSPVSVLQPSFEEDDCLAADSSGLMKLRGTERSLKSSLIDKSPPIGSIARTLSWDESMDDINHSVKSSPTGIEEEQDWYLFIQTLLLAAGFDGSVQPDTLLSKWHSLENPLDPSLRDKYPDMSNKELVHKAKWRQHRSSRKLAFDYVNSAITQITQYGLDKSKRVGSMSSNHLLSPTLVDYLWTQLKDWFAGEVNRTECDGEDTNSMVAENAVRDEIVGRTWDEVMRLEVDGFGCEIESKILEELVDEAVINFTGRI